MSIDLSQFHEAFFSEALGSLDQAEDDLLRIERGEADRDCVDSVLRAIHSVKGSAGTLGFQQIGHFAHEFESVLEALRKQSLHPPAACSDEQVSILLAALDLLRTQILNAQQKLGDISASRVEALTTKLQTLSQRWRSEPAMQSLRIRFAPTPAMLRTGNDPLRYLDALSEMGSLRSTALWQPCSEPGTAPLDESRCDLHWELQLQSTRSPGEILALFEWIEDLCDFTVVPDSAATSERASQPACPGSLPAPLSPPDTEVSNGPTPATTPAAVAVAGNEAGSSARRVHRSIQVAPEKIDALLGQLGELAICQSELEARLAAPELADLFVRLSRQTRQLQDAILAMRMSPVSTLFRRFERVVRDAEVELHKKVSIDIEGESNELDSSILERLIDPFTHLIRNALDHGIESPAERLACGKPESARLRLRAEQRGSNMVISIEDDGRGIATTRVRQRAIDTGLASKDTLLGEAQWAQMIFAPGFSTAARVNQWSGRGVGLDAVAQSVKALNGQIRTHSSEGKGTRFSIILPLTLALTDALIIRAGHERYALAMSSVAECLQARRENLRTLPTGQRLYQLRGQMLPWSGLDEVMGLGETQDSPERFVALVLHNGDEACLLKVDEILGQRQIVIKSIDKNLGAARYCHSATILGDGQVIFVLDPGPIVKDVGACAFEAA